MLRDRSALVKARAQKLEVGDTEAGCQVQGVGAPSAGHPWSRRRDG